MAMGESQEKDRRGPGAVTVVNNHTRCADFLLDFLKDALDVVGIAEIDFNMQRAVGSRLIGKTARGQGELVAFCGVAKALATAAPMFGPAPTKEPRG